MVVRGEQRFVLAGFVRLRPLRRHWRSVCLVGVTDLLGCGVSLYSALSAIESNVVVVHDDRLVIDICDIRDVHVCDGAVIEKMTLAPFAAGETLAAVSEAIVDSAVETNGGSPIAFVKSVDSVIPAPIAGSPKQAGLGRFYPGAGDPVIAVIVVPGPVAGRPDKAFAGANGLFINWQRGRAETYGDANTDLRGRRR